MTGRSAELLGYVGLEGEASTAAWCSVNGLIAVGARISPYIACVYLINVHCPTRKVSLHVPLEGPSDDIISVCWSPAGSRRVLLTATKNGRLLLWSQQPADQPTQQHICMEDWWSHDPIDLIINPSSGSAAASDSSVPHLVTVSWLRAPPAWVWSSSTMQHVDFHKGAIHGLFLQGSQALGPGEDAAAATDDLAFHWVRPGTLALAAVLSNGAAVVCWAHLSAYGQLQWNRTSENPMQPAGTTVQAADVTVCSEGVAVCYVTQQEPSTVRVVQLQGSPLHAQCCQLDGAEPIQLPLRQVAVHNQGDAGSSICGLSWDPSSNGTRLMSIMQDGPPAVGQPAGCVNTTLALCTLQQHQLLQVAQVSITTAQQQQQQQQQIAWLLDGMLLCAGAQGLQVYQVDPLQQIQATFMQPFSRSQTGTGSSGGWVQSVAASPHGVAVAAVVRPPSAPNNASSSNKSRLLLYNVPAYAAQTAGPIQAAAGRLLYALMLQQHTWDVVQHTLCAACQPLTDARGTTVTDGLIQPSAVAEVLALVDSKVTSQQPTLKSPYSALWDLLKLAILVATPGGEARAVGIDLRLRVVGTTLKPVFEVLREDASTRQRDTRNKLPGLAALHNYLADIVQFVLACLKTWLVRRTSSSEEAGLAQHVPCIRHILDSRPCTLLVMLYVLIHSATVSFDVTLIKQGGKEELLYAAYKQFTKAAPATKDPNWEQVMRELIPGALQLHYADTAPECLNSLTLQPEKLWKHMETNEIWNKQPVLTDADITAEAIRLGLLPVRPPSAIGLCKREQQQHKSFRRQAGESLENVMPGAQATADHLIPSTTRLNGMKRRRWELQLGSAMGESLGTAGGVSSGLFDLAHLMPFDADEPGYLQSVDGSMLAHEAVSALDDGGRTAPKAVVDQCAHGWMYACPISGEMWVRGT